MKAGKASRGASRIREIVVVVPARDEETLIARCLESLLAAVEQLTEMHPRIRVRIVVVADACRDSTADIVRDFSDRGVEVIVSAAGRVGQARATGVATVLEGRPPVALRSWWIACTDADSAVPPNWLTHQVELSDAGADTVVGTVRPDPADLTTPQMEQWRSTHVPGRPNGHVHGANLGIRATTYRLAGGFDDVPEHEDNLIVDRIRRSGARVVATDVAEVVTSGRRAGRTPGGYAEHLAVSLGSAPSGRERETAS